MLCRDISGRFQYAWIRKQVGRRRRNRDEILAEKLVPGREGYGYWAPGKFRKIFLALFPILDGSNISCGPTLSKTYLGSVGSVHPLAVFVGSTFILAHRASLRGMHTATATLKTL